MFWHFFYIEDSNSHIWYEWNRTYIKNIIKINIKCYKLVMAKSEIFTKKWPAFNHHLPVKWRNLFGFHINRKKIRTFPFFHFSTFTAFLPSYYPLYQFSKLKINSIKLFVNFITILNVAKIPSNAVFGGFRHVGNPLNYCERYMELRGFPTLSVTANCHWRKSPQLFLNLISEKYVFTLKSQILNFFSKKVKN